MLRNILYILLAFFIISCKSNQKLTYLNDVQIQSIERIYKGPYLLQEGDVIHVDITSELLPVQNEKMLGDMNSGSMNFDKSPLLSVNGYTVDNFGKITIPILGDFQVLGLTLPDVKELIQIRLTDFLKKESFVNIKLLNNSFTILGEVKNEGVYYINENRINVLEGIGFSGGFTIYANNNEVLLNRSFKDSVYTYNIDLNGSLALNLELQPHDIIYVRPLKKGAQKQLNNPTVSIVLSSLSTALLILNIVLK